MKYAITMNEALRREVVHLTDAEDGEEEITLCGTPIIGEWQVLETLEGYSLKMAMDCQSCKRAQDKQNETPKQQEKPRLRMYFGHPLY